MICQSCNANPTGRSDRPVCHACDPRPRCRHCQYRVANRSRGLCWQCYAVDAVRDLYPPNEIAQTFVNGGRAQPDVNGRRPLPRPTIYAPGTVEKIDVMADRASRREAIHHPMDADHSGEGRRVESAPRGRWALLSSEDKAAIVAARAEGVQAHVLAERYGVLPSTIYDIASRYREVAS